MPTLRLEDDPFAPRYEEEVREDAHEDEHAFDRMAYASAVLDRLKPRARVLALCSARARIRVETGRAWGGGPGEEWAVLYIPPRASKRSIALAVAGIARKPLEPYELDVLLSNTR